VYAFNLSSIEFDIIRHFELSENSLVVIDLSETNLHKTLKPCGGVVDIVIDPGKNPLSASAKEEVTLIAKLLLSLETKTIEIFSFVLMLRFAKVDANMVAFSADIFPPYLLPIK
jgi:hypothetical protein